MEEENRQPQSDESYLQKVFFQSAFNLGLFQSN